MTKKLKLGVVAAAVALAGYWYFSPLLAIQQMRSAAKSGDADTFNSHIDYPRLRDSFKGQLSAQFAQHMATQPGSGGDMEKAGAALGSMLGMAMVNNLVDAFVRPETIMRAMSEGQMAPKKASGSAPAGEKAEPSWKTERKGMDKYIVYATSASEPDDKRFGLVLERSGFATWKLTEVRLSESK